MRKRDFNMNWVYYKEGSKYRQVVDLPHDAMIVEQRDPESLSGSAGLTFREVYTFMRRHLTFLMTGVISIYSLNLKGISKQQSVYQWFGSRGYPMDICHLLFVRMNF